MQSDFFLVRENFYFDIARGPFLSANYGYLKLERISRNQGRQRRELSMRIVIYRC